MYFQKKGVLGTASCLACGKPPSPVSIFFFFPWSRGCYLDGVFGGYHLILHFFFHKENICTHRHLKRFEMVPVLFCFPVEMLWMSNKAFLVLFHLHRYFDSISDLLCSASFRHDSSWSFPFARAGVMPHVLVVGWWPFLFYLRWTSSIISLCLGQVGIWSVKPVLLRRGNGFLHFWIKHESHQLALVFLEKKYLPWWRGYCLPWNCSLTIH